MKASGIRRSTWLALLIFLAALALYILVRPNPKASQTINFTSSPPAAVVGGGTYHVAATGGASGNLVTFTLDPASSGCAISGSTVSFTSAGVCVIDANQAGNANYSAAPTISQSFAVLAKDPASPAATTTTTPLAP